MNKYPHAANGAKIKAFRRELGQYERSQEKVAAAAGMTRRHLIRLENGESLPGVEIRDRLAELFQCDPVEIEAYDDAPFRTRR